jgi:hypothetical protein
MNYYEELNMIASCGTQKFELQKTYGEEINRGEAVKQYSFS